ncbi:MAG: FG-GAP repeat domain-containing protein, partial [Gaiellaceae bacterium]
DGSGNFRRVAAPPLPAGAQTCSLASADFNGDGSPDLAVAISSGSAVAILLGDGSGHFSAAPGSPVPVGGTPEGVVSADVNGDGRPDLVVPVADSTGRITGIEVLLGDGAGGFVPAPGSPVLFLAGDSLAVAAADLNGDGKVDLAVANTALNEVQVLLGDGSGSFAEPVSVESLPDPHAIGVGDVDGNGTPDLAVLGTNGVSILLGDGTGHFAAAPGSPVHCVGDDLLVADLNGDGTPDLAVANADAGAISVEMASGGGRFRQAAYAPFSAGYPLLLSAADFEGDGKTDIVALTPGAPYWPVGPRGSVLLLQTSPTPEIRPGRALRPRADPVFETRSQITALAADGKHAAVCGGVPIAWTAPGRASVTFKTGSYGGCDGELAVGGNRVAWVEGLGCGNLSCDEGVFVSKLSGGRRREIDEAENDCGAGPCDPTGVFIAQLLGGGPLIAWNDWTVECAADCDAGVDDVATFAITSQSLNRIYGGRARTVRTDRAAHPLLAVGGGRLALELGAKVVVLKPNGVRVATVPAPGLESVALAPTELAVAGRTSLDVYDPANGDLRKTIPLGASAALQLAGITPRLALLRGPHALVLVRLGDGSLISFPLKAAAATRLVDAKLTAAGLFYAYNVPRAKAKGRVVFEPTSRLLARF